MNNLKLLRKERKLTQHEVAIQIGTTQQNYSRYENGNVQADYDTLTKLAAFFNVSVDYLLLADTVKNYLDNKNPIFNNISSVPVYHSISRKNNHELSYDMEGSKLCELPSLDYDNFFYLRVMDDNMKNARINHGDLILCYRTEMIKNNDIVVAIIHDDNAVIARYKMINNLTYLLIDSDLILINDETHYIIIGKVIRLEIKF